MEASRQGAGAEAAGSPGGAGQQAAAILPGHPKAGSVGRAYDALKYVVHVSPDARKVSHMGRGWVMWLCLRRLIHARVVTQSHGGWMSHGVVLG